MAFGTGLILLQTNHAVFHSQTWNPKPVIRNPKPQSIQNLLVGLEFLLSCSSLLVGLEFLLLRFTCWT